MNPDSISGKVPIQIQIRPVYTEQSWYFDKLDLSNLYEPRILSITVHTEVVLEYVTVMRYQWGLKEHRHERKFDTLFHHCTINQL